MSHVIPFSSSVSARLRSRKTKHDWFWSEAHRRKEGFISSCFFIDFIFFSPERKQSLTEFLAFSARIWSPVSLDGEWWGVVRHKGFSAVNHGRNVQHNSAAQTGEVKYLETCNKLLARRSKDGIHWTCPRAAWDGWLLEDKHSMRYSRPSFKEESYTVEVSY